MTWWGVNLTHTLKLDVNTCRSQLVLSSWDPVYKHHLVFRIYWVWSKLPGKGYQVTLLMCVCVYSFWQTAHKRTHRIHSAHPTRTHSSSQTHTPVPAPWSRWRRACCRGRRSSPAGDWCRGSGTDWAWRPWPWAETWRSSSSGPTTHTHRTHKVSHPPSYTHGNISAPFHLASVWTNISVLKPNILKSISDTKPTLRCESPNQFLSLKSGYWIHRWNIICGHSKGVFILDIRQYNRSPCGGSESICVCLFLVRFDVCALVHVDFPFH